MNDEQKERNLKIQKERIYKILPAIKNIIPEVINKAILTGQFDDPDRIVLKAVVEEIESERKEKRIQAGLDADY